NSENVSASIALTNSPNITMTNTVDKQHPAPGDTLTYTVTVINNGTANATSVVLTNASPNNTTFAPNAYGAGSGVQVDGVAKTNASDSDEVTVSGGTITVNLGIMQPGVLHEHIIHFKNVVN
ncbi:MAG: DUF11 domain-containing protein, partial [Bacteroidota bacterium]|nr:DUF11 domain-containing protein [Bacteroidota bacterium]